MGEQVDIHRRILSANSTGELMSVYDNWSEDYDKVLTEQWGYNSPQMAADLLAASIACDSISVLDAGCGTGLVGELLHNLGYHHIDGLDLSPEMLEKAKARRVYRTLGEADLMASVTLDPVYDAVICVGVFSHHRSQPFDLVKLFAGLKPGAALVATVNGKGWRDIDWETLLEQSRREHGFNVENISDIPYLTQQGISGKLLVIRPSPS